MKAPTLASACGVRVATPLGALDVLTRDGAVVHAWFVAEAAPLPPLPTEPADMQACAAATTWYAAYFDGKTPAPEAFAPTARGTALQQQVWSALLALPYGHTTTYGALTAALGLSPLHIRAVAGAIARNPVAVVVPCHRVLGADGSLTGYAGGLERKRALLTFEQGAALTPGGQLPLDFGL